MTKMVRSAFERIAKIFRGADMKNRYAIKRPRKNKGFTLVEILIVVIILGILAAIVIPQFTSASTDARKSSLSTQLQSLQQQIALYQLQHNNNPPLLITTGWTTMTEYSDVNGNLSTTSDSTHIYGPYFQSPPMNPLTAAADASVVATTPTGTAGWVYSETTGKIYASGTVSTNYFNPTTGDDSATAPY
jgi:general secretion pathway protein G